MMLCDLMVQPLCYRLGLCDGYLLIMMLSVLTVQRLGYRQVLYERA
jgi:hypothetical protein